MRIEITVGHQPHRYIAECKSKADRKSVVSHVGMNLFRVSEPGPLIAPYISREIAGFCRGINLQFIDTHGSAYLNAPGVYVQIRGDKDVAAKSSLGEGRGSANLALNYPDIVPAVLVYAYLMATYDPRNSSWHSENAQTAVDIRMRQFSTGMPIN